MIAMTGNLWDKYAVSSQALETERAATLAELNGFLRRLKYLPDFTDQPFWGVT